MNKNKVRANGSIYTTTYFKKEVGEIRVTIFIKNHDLRSLGLYMYKAMIREPNKQYFINLAQGVCTNYDNKSILEYITIEELYESMHNHWLHMCPLPKLGCSQVNSSLVDFKVTPINVNYEKERRLYKQR